MGAKYFDNSVMYHPETQPQMPHNFWKYFSTCCRTPARLCSCLCDAHVKDQGVLCEGHKVNLCVDDKFCPRHEIPVEDKEGVRRDVLGIRALVEKLREIFARRHWKVFLPSTVLRPSVFFSLAEVHLLPCS